jgi:hypothetical protein
VLSPTSGQRERVDHAGRFTRLIVQQSVPRGGRRRAGRQKGRNDDLEYRSTPGSPSAVPECERIYTEDEARQLWECSRETCQETFVDDDRECPCCGSAFSRRLADFGCEDCLEALEEMHDKKDGIRTDHWDQSEESSQVRNSDGSVRSRP